MQPSAVDVVVLGGGPAGSAAARLLATWGHSVALVARPPRQASLAESLPPSCTKLFEQIGIQHLIDDAGFLRASGNTVCWANGEPRVEHFAAGVAGYQVARDAFDALLLAAARTTGVTIHEAIVRGVARDGDVWRVSTDSAADLRARWVFDATGRTGVLARRGLRRSESGGRTFAVVGVWERDDGWPVDDETHTLVESYSGGWAWSVPVSATRRFVTVMLDPAVTELPGRSRLAAAYGAELANTMMLRRLVDGARLVADPWGCDASPYTA
ncbi:MAG TPA: tryptophan 7-halogenase, partial [Gemmatimonadaceae bacterium]